MASAAAFPALTTSSDARLASRSCTSFETVICASSFGSVTLASPVTVMTAPFSAGSGIAAAPAAITTPTMRAADSFHFNILPSPSIAFFPRAGSGPCRARLHSLETILSAVCEKILTELKTILTEPKSSLLERNSRSLLETFKQNVLWIRTERKGWRVRRRNFSVCRGPRGARRYNRSQSSTISPPHDV